MNKLDKLMLLSHMKGKKESFRREHAITSDELRKEKLWGEIKILEFYIDEIDKGKFDTSKITEKRHANVGENIIITANSNDHGFFIGDVVRVVAWAEFDQDDEYGVEAKSIDGGQPWYVDHNDYEVIVE